MNLTLFVIFVFWYFASNQDFFFKYSPNKYKVCKDCVAISHKKASFTFKELKLEQS